MYTTCTIDEPVERSQETTGEESSELKREIARRFREGIGVDADPMEADYWESQIFSVEVVTQISPTGASEVEPTTDILTEDDYRKMDIRELLRAYRRKEPFGIYYLAVQMAAQGEAVHVLEAMDELEEILEQPQNGETVADVRSLLARAKILKGQACESPTINDLAKACQCYEEAAIELGYMEAFSCLVSAYRKSGSLQSHEQELLPLLRRAEEGDDEVKYIAADVYAELGRKSLAVFIYEELAEKISVEPKVRIEAMRRLLSWDELRVHWLEKLSADGNGAATYVLADIAAPDFNEQYWYAEYSDEEDMYKTLRLYEQSVRQDERLLGCAQERIDEIRPSLDEFQDEIRAIKMRQQQIEQKRIADAQWARQCRRNSWIFWPASLAIAVGMALIFCALCGWSEPTWVQSMLYPAAVEQGMIGEFVTDNLGTFGSFVAVLFGEAMPFLFFLGGVVGTVLYNCLVARKHYYEQSFFNYLLAALSSPAGVIVLYLGLITAFGVIYLILKAILALIMLGIIIGVLFSFGNSRK